MPNIAEMQGLVGNWYLTQSVDTVIMYITVTLPFEHTVDQKNWNDLESMVPLQRFRQFAMVPFR